MLHFILHETEGRYDRGCDWLTPDRRFEFSYDRNGWWYRFDMYEDVFEHLRVREKDLPDNLDSRDGFRRREEERQRVTALFGAVEQLSFYVS